MKSKMTENVEIVRERERERELYSSEISFINNAKKYKVIDRDGLCAKVKKLLQNGLSFLCAKEVIENKDKYA